SPPLKSDSLRLGALLSRPKAAGSGWLSGTRDLYLMAYSDIEFHGMKMGRLVFGRRLSHQFLTGLNLDDATDVMVYYGGRLLATTDTSTALPFVDPGKIFTEIEARGDIYIWTDEEHDRAIGFTALRNIENVEVAAIGWTAAQSPANVIVEAIQNILYYFGIPLFALVIFAALILGFWIEKPIRSLSKTMERIRTTGDLSERAVVSGGGEIASMSQSFNQMLEQLAKQHEELSTFRTMIMTMREGVVIEDQDHRVVYMNPQMLELLGKEGHESGWQEYEFELRRMITAKNHRGEDENGFTPEEVEWQKPNGKRIQALRTSGKLKDPHGRMIGVLSTFVDVTERNDLEIELIETSRMAFLGLYSQGIMHNINGPLNTIIGFSSLLNKRPEVSELSERIYNDAQRIAEQINILGRRWHRTGHQQTELLNMNDIIEDELKFLEADLFYKHNVEKNFNLDAKLPLIAGRYGDFSHAFLNIISNALDAMLESPLHQLTITTKADDKEVSIEVSDTGIGINSENVNRIFVPFFSTKRRNLKEGIPSGAGLGLPIARKILEPYNAQFEVESELGKGTTMRIRFPRDAQKLTVRQNEAEAGIVN
ncbi:HAMP domain-containing protein, partial [bacterium]|nr:HAMP domain-containing protein [bacterium]